MALRATSLGPKLSLFIWFVFCFPSVFCLFGGVFKDQVRWPEGPPHLAPNPPLFCFFLVFFQKDNKNRTCLIGFLSVSLGFSRSFPPPLSLSFFFFSSPRSSYFLLFLSCIFFFIVLLPLLGSIIGDMKQDNMIDKNRFFMKETQHKQKTRDQKRGETHTKKKHVMLKLKTPTFEKARNCTTDVPTWAFN